MTVYRARLDGFVVGVSVGVLGLLGGVVGGFVIMAGRRPASTFTTVALVAAIAFVIAIVVFAWVYTPRAFRVHDGVLRIQRPAGDVTIPLASIVSVEPLDAFVGLSLKAPPGGNSGLFGMYGTFYRRDLGKFQMYGRAATRAVLLETSDGKVVVTPEHRDAFISDLRKETTT